MKPETKSTVNTNAFEQGVKVTVNKRHLETNYYWPDYPEYFVVQTVPKEIAKEFPNSIKLWDPRKEKGSSMSMWFVHSSFLKVYKK